MAKTLLKTALAASLMNMAEADTTDFGDRKWVTVLVDILEGVRGFWLGFNRGIY